MSTLLTINRIPQNGRQWRYGEKFVVTQNLTDPSYLIDGYDGNKFDFTLNGDVDLELQNIKEGVEYRFILTVDRANASIPRPVSVYFSSLDDYCIAWKNLFTATPKISDNAEIKLYRSGHVIYAEFHEEFVGNGNESDSCEFGSYNQTYTPTLTNVLNITSSTAYECNFMRVGNTVTVSGKVDIDQTSPGAYELGISLPVASNFTAEENCSGVGNGSASGDDPCVVKADVVNNFAILTAKDTDASNHAHHFIFTYTIK